MPHPLPRVLYLRTHDNVRQAWPVRYTVLVMQERDRRPGEGDVRGPTKGDFSGEQFSDWDNPEDEVEDAPEGYYDDEEADEEGYIPTNLEITEDGKVKGGLRDFFESELEEMDRYMNALQIKE